MKTFYQFLVIAITMLGLDLVWLGYLGKKYYDQYIGQIMNKTSGNLEVNYSGAAVVYILMIFSILLFVLPKANGDSKLALFYGILMGAIIYGVYDYTNLAILRHWPWQIALIDLFWGMILFGTCSWVACYLVK